MTDSVIMYLMLCNTLNIRYCACFFQLQQLRIVSRSLSPNAALTLVCAFVCSRIVVNYCQYIVYSVGNFKQVQSIAV